MSRARRTVRVLAAAAALLLPVAGCSLLEPDTQPTGLGPGNTAPPAGTTGLERFYAQDLEWGGCQGSDGECATLEVPMDYEQPDGQTIEIAVLRVQAKGEAAGSLVVNPGGPGGSGVDYAAAADFIVSDQIRRHFDVVGFDPRGVGRSHPVDCLSDADMDDYLAKDPTPDTPEEKSAGERAQKEFADGCKDKTGELLGHVSTADAARDMDVLRAALGDGKLTYLGKSYGTYLGATYADLFPDRSGRMVLDGVLPPDATSEEVAIGQAKGFDTATRAWAQDCVDDDCPLGSSVDEVVEHVQSQLEELDEQPLPASAGIELTEGWATWGIAQAMYDQGMWSQLTDALVAADDGDGGPLSELGRAYAGRDSGGTYQNNMLEALPAVSCLDTPDGPGDPDDLVARAEKEAPIWGRALASESPCAQWPIDPTNTPHEVDAEGADPILVVGTTRDPATPYEWAQRLHEQLADSALITHEGDGHTAYMRQNSCVDEAVDEFWLTGTTPDGGELTCEE
ncbi:MULTISPECIES: alpha/beta hydrolase [Janibacter]|uniref:Alpha/beta hydrolase fold n=1 Tax=Janibacter indicus TaxID=857417 RepID=A0A1W2CTN7_9MICO|nr:MULTISPECIES: alpha/beta hydrolase [Janibacter]QNF93711.1 alpha/beta fold hydrolase [Janibacter sp. YB324]SMC88615.1 alpha/beta hydrolase fold [Janibacter indicus]